MMSAVFKEHPLIAQSWMQALLKQHPEENALLEVNNLLARKDITAINKTEIDHIEQTYGLSLQKTFPLNLEEFYAVTLHYYMKSVHFSTSERSVLTHLRMLLDLSSEQVKFLHHTIAEPFYSEQVRKRVGSITFHKEDNTYLKRLAQDLEIDLVTAENVLIESKQSKLNERIRTLAANARWDQEKEELVEQLSSQLEVRPTPAYSKLLNKYRNYARLESNLLTEISVVIPLQKDEKCYCQLTNVEWLEERASTRGDYYDFRHNQTFQQLDLSTGFVDIIRVNFPILKIIDKGSIYLTNKRILFDGSIKQVSIRHEAVYGMDAYTNAFSIKKVTGKSPIITTKESSDVFVIIWNLIKKGNF